MLRDLVILLGLLVLGLLLFIGATGCASQRVIDASNTLGAAESQLVTDSTAGKIPTDMRHVVKLAVLNARAKIAIAATRPSEIEDAESAVVTARSYATIYQP